MEEMNGALQVRSKPSTNCLGCVDREETMYTAVSKRGGQFVWRKSPTSYVACFY